MDQTIVFSCKAGIRSMHAAQFAAMSGYTKLTNYIGGADDWFRWICLERMLFKPTQQEVLLEKRFQRKNEPIYDAL